MRGDFKGELKVDTSQHKPLFCSIHPLSCWLWNALIPMNRGTSGGFFHSWMSSMISRTLETHTARLHSHTAEWERTHPSPHVHSFSAKRTRRHRHFTLSAALLPLWLCCRVSSTLAEESVAPSSASLRLVALSSDRRLVTSWLADWMAPSMRWASCLLSSIIFRIFAWGREGNPDKVSCWQVDHFLGRKVSPNKFLLFFPLFWLLLFPFCFMRKPS